MDALQYSSTRTLTDEIKRGTLFNLHNSPLSFLSSSPYDSAWLAMVPRADHPGEPMFRPCLDWVIKSQRDEGFWDDGMSPVPPIECLPSTLACLVALKRWNVGAKSIEKGIKFLHENTEKLLMRAGVNGHGTIPRWFCIVFPAMLELAHSHGLPVVFGEGLCGSIISDIFQDRQQILQSEEVVGKDRYLPLLAYLEALPPWYQVHGDYIASNLSGDGSLFHSPSATAGAYMATGDVKCLAYLQSLTENFPNRGVPSFYPVGEEIIKLVMANQITRLGSAEHFNEEIRGILTQIHRNYGRGSLLVESDSTIIAARLYQDSLAFWLFRVNGYDVSPSIFCWFLRDDGIRDHIKDNYKVFATVLLNIYRATELMFPGEPELREARSFSRKYLERILTNQGDVHLPPGLRRSIEHELSHPWAARMDHLEHRMWMEGSDADALWMGKCSFHRLSWNHNNELLQLAVKNYTDRQSIFCAELEEAKRWSKSMGLCDMGFGREKTTYCYFACATSLASLGLRPHTRLMVVKSAIIITVADDFHDTEGSMEELEQLTDAVLRWDGRGLASHGKTIFKALDDLVSDIRKECLARNMDDITSNLRDLWYETFLSWLIEAKWAKGRVETSVDEYIRNGMTSAAAHTMVLPAAYFVMSPMLSCRQFLSSQYQDITRLLMLTTRLLNDMQGYKKEEEEGKMNLLWIYLIENPGLKMEDSIEHARRMLDETKEEFLQHVLTTDDMPKSCKQLHLSCFKVFHMFYDSSNRFDSDTEFLQDIEKALVSPPEVQTLRSSKAQSLPLSLTSLHPKSRKQIEEIRNNQYGLSVRPTESHLRIFSVHRRPLRHAVNRSSPVLMRSRLKPCFI